jgi:hypothetical protein
MKRLLFTGLFFLAFVFPILAQDEKDLSEEVPVESLTLKKGNIPPAVIKAGEDMFKGTSMIKWGIFPYQLKDYGWVVDPNYNEPIDHYEIHFHATDGSEIYAVFESTGELISTRISKKNTEIPSPIMKALANSEYKDWKLVEDTELIKNNQKKVVDHFWLKVEKDGKRKNLYYTSTGERLKNK